MYIHNARECQKCQRRDCVTDMWHKIQTNNLEREPNHSIIPISASDGVQGMDIVRHSVVHIQIANHDTSIARARPKINLPKRQKDVIQRKMQYKNKYLLLKLGAELVQRLDFPVLEQIA